MTLPLHITPEAETDLRDACGWYDRQRAGLGDEFLLCVEEGLARIRRLPQSGREVFPTVRRVVVRRFPYGIFYRIDTDQIAVIAIYHGKRDPRGWQTRA